ncbi:MAG: hypothetical protein ACQRW7_09785 [Caulobacterales bacterium]|uniref:hypothetical protein n=1 Tax=Glycocaulis sp. TaxID=1969725 RepID=UPI003F9F63EA
MSREIDERKKKKALRRLERVRRALADAEADGDTEAAREARALLTEWEDEFLGSVEERLNTFGSAFNDPEKGLLDEPLSQLQAAKLKELEAKAKGKEIRRWMRSGFKSKEKGTRSGFSSKRAAPRANIRDINEDVPEAPVKPARPIAVPAPAPRNNPPRKSDAGTPASDASAPLRPATPAGRARFTVIKGGKDD